MGSPLPRLRGIWAKKAGGGKALRVGRGLSVEWVSFRTLPTPRPVTLDRNLLRQLSDKRRSWSLDGTLSLYGGAGLARRAGSIPAALAGRAAAATLPCGRRAAEGKDAAGSCRSLPATMAPAGGRARSSGLAAAEHVRAPWLSFARCRQQAPRLPSVGRGGGCADRAPAAGYCRRSTGGKPQPGRGGADAGWYGYADRRSRRRAAEATPVGRPSETLLDTTEAGAARPRAGGRVAREGWSVGGEAMVLDPSTGPGRMGGKPRPGNDATQHAARVGESVRSRAGAIPGPPVARRFDGFREAGAARRPRSVVGKGRKDRLLAPASPESCRVMPA